MHESKQNLRNPKSSYHHAFYPHESHKFKQRLNEENVREKTIIHQTPNSHLKD